MRRFVVDATVAAQWYFEEPYTAQAELLLDGAFELLAPDLLYVEIAALLARRAGRGEIGAEGAQQVLAELRQVPFEWKPVSQLAPAALAIALRHRLALAESLYLALAQESRAPLITADRRFYDLLRAGPLASAVVFVSDLAAD